MSHPHDRNTAWPARVVHFLRADGEGRQVQREDEENLRRTLNSYSALTSQFVFILTLSSAIASLGLMADSAVAIVGAMLIAPLMKPILAYAYGIVTADWKLQLRATITLLTGIVLTMLVAGAAEKVVGLRGPTTEFMARTEPSLIDLGVAVAAGLAASLASIRHNVADALPGVAIAVALVPPLCVAGIGFALGEWAVGWGATLLFAVNLVAIIITAVAVFLLDGYGKMQRATHGLMLLITLSGCGLVIPLTQALRQLQADDLAQEVVERYLHSEFPKNHVVHPNDLSRLDALLFTDHVFVFMEIKSPQSQFGESRCRELQRRLSVAFNAPVNLKVQLLLSREFRIYPQRNPDGSLPDYGDHDLIPRR